MSRWIFAFPARSLAAPFVASAGEGGHALHLPANAIAGTARERGAEVVVERLGGLKQTVVEARPRGSRKSGWRRVRKHAQLGKLAKIVSYKLALAGLPPAREVVTARTSITCLAGAVSDRRNRTEQSRLSCIGCGLAAHADSVGAVNIARRGIAMPSMTKGGSWRPSKRTWSRGSQISVSVREPTMGNQYGDYPLDAGMPRTWQASAHMLDTGRRP